MISTAIQSWKQACATGDGTYPYTPKSLADFLKLDVGKVENALNTLALMEEDVATDEDYSGLTPIQAHEVSRAKTRVSKKQANKELAKAVVMAL